MVMDFYSAYGQGFVRVAACTMHTAIADPAANAESVLRLARECHDEGVGLAVFPELTLSGYSIEDILLQDALLDAVEDALLDVVAASADLLPVLVVGAPLRYQHRIYNTAVVIHRGRVLGVAPKSYLPTYREFYERRQMARGRRRARRRSGIGRRRGAVRPRPAVRRRRRARASCCTSRSARTCSCRSRRAPRPRWRARRCSRTCPAARSRSAAPRTARCCARSASSRCLAAYVYAAAGEGESTTDLAWDGQTMVWENGVLLAEIRALPGGRAALGRRRRPRAAALGAAADGHLRRQPACTTASTQIVPAHRVPARPARRATSACAARSSGSRSCPPDPDTAGTGLLRGVQHPGGRAGAAAARAGLSEGGDRRLRRPRLDACADRRRPRDGPRRPAAQRHSRVHAARLRDRRADQGQRDPAVPRRWASTFEEIDIKADRRTDARARSATRSRAARRSTTSRSRTCRPACAPTTCSASPTSAAASCSAPATCPSSRSGWSTYGVGDQMSHYNVNGGVPKTLIQHLIRWVISSRQFDDRVNEVLKSVLDTEISPELVPQGEDEEIQSSEGQGRPVCAAGLLAVPGAAVRVPALEDRVPGLARLARPEHGDWPAGFPDGQAARVLARRRFGTGCRSSCSGSTRSPSSSGRRCRTGPRCRTAGRCRRAVTGGRRRTCRPGSGWTRSSARFPRTRSPCFAIRGTYR